MLSAAILRIAADFEQSIDNMPDMTYRSSDVNGKPLRWLHGEVKTSPMSIDARKGDRDAITRIAGWRNALHAAVTSYAGYWFALS